MSGDPIAAGTSSSRRRFRSPSGSGCGTVIAELLPSWGWALAAQDGRSRRWRLQRGGLAFAEREGLFNAEMRSRMNLSAFAVRRTPARRSRSPGRQRSGVGARLRRLVDLARRERLPVRSSSSANGTRIEAIVAASGLDDWTAPWELLGPCRDALASSRRTAAIGGRGPDPAQVAAAMADVDDLQLVSSQHQMRWPRWPSAEAIWSWPPAKAERRGVELTAGQPVEPLGASSRSNVGTARSSADRRLAQGAGAGWILEASRRGARRPRWRPAGLERTRRVAAASSGEGLRFTAALLRRARAMLVAGRPRGAAAAAEARAILEDLGAVTLPPWAARAGRPDGRRAPTASADARRRIAAVPVGFRLDSGAPRCHHRSYLSAVPHRPERRPPVSPAPSEGGRSWSEQVTLTVNGVEREVVVEPRRLLVQTLREDLGLTGTHVGCDTSQCGACTVHLDGRAVKSCAVLAVQADGHDVMTIEGMAPVGGLHPIQTAFWEKHGLQCGFCTPGMIMAAADLLDRNPDPTDDEIRHAIEGNICRCTGYHNIVAAIREAASTRAPAPTRRPARTPDRRHPMTTDVLGAPIKRVEDPRFITGKGRYLDDIKLPGMTYMAILRSPYAHANIRSIDTSAAKAMPGVVAVLTGADVPYNPLPMAWPAGGVRRASRTTSTRPRALATDSVKWTGEGVAAVIAETPEQAADAVEAIHVEWEPLPAVVDAEKATQPGAPQLHENAPNNVVFEWTVGDKAGTDAADRRGRGRRPPADRQPAADPEPDGGPRRHRAVQPGHRRVHDLDVEPDAAHPAAAPGRVRDRHPRAQGPLHLARRRRGVRHEDLLLRRHGPRDARLEAHRRPAGQVGRDPARELPDARPTAATTSPTSRSPARRDGEITGLRVKTYANLGGRLSTIGPGIPTTLYAPGPVGLLQDPERLLRGHRRLHEHDVRRRLSRRRPTGGDLRHRAGDGPVRRRDRDGPRGDPAQELHRPGRVPVRQPVGARDGGRTARRSTSTRATTSRPSTRP